VWANCDFSLFAFRWRNEWWECGTTSLKAWPWW
jgi:hypothetical protein